MFFVVQDDTDDGEFDAVVSPIFLAFLFRAFVFLYSYFIANAQPAFALPSPIQVDLISHPLKSELNWPLGKKEPLDFTRSRAGDGLRWQIPFYLLDAVLAFSEETTVRGRRGKD